MKLILARHWQVGHGHQARDRSIRRQRLAPRSRRPEIVRGKHQHFIFFISEVSCHIRFQDATTVLPY